MPPNLISNGFFFCSYGKFWLNWITVIVVNVYFSFWWWFLSLFKLVQILIHLFWEKTSIDFLYILLFKENWPRCPLINLFSPLIVCPSLLYKRTHLFLFLALWHTVEHTLLTPYSWILKKNCSTLKRIKIPVNILSAFSFRFAVFGSSTGSN